MSFPKKFTFYLDKRQNRFSKNGEDWALSIIFDYGDPWVIESWEQSPSEETVNKAKEVILRAFEVYHKHITVPSFYLEEEKD